MKKLLLVLSAVVALCGFASMAEAAGTLPATLTWTNPDTNDGVQIEKSTSLSSTFTVLKQLPAGTTTYVDATNGPGDNACYRATYFNGSGVGPYTVGVCKSFPQLPTQAPATFGVN